MPIFYRGAAVGTYYYEHNAMLEGFAAHKPTGEATSGSMIGHIARGTTNSPYVSLTRSFGVARSYALAARKRYPASQQGFVYVLELDKKSGIELLDPVKQMTRLLGNPYAEPSYHHDGAQDFLLGVADPHGHWRELQRPVDQPPPAEGAERPAQLHEYLETMVRSLRDSEILAVRAIPKKYIQHRLEIQ